MPGRRTFKRKTGRVSGHYASRWQPPVTATSDHLAAFAAEGGWDPGVRKARLTRGAIGQATARELQP